MQTWCICPTCLMNHAWTEVSSNGKSLICCPFCSMEWRPHTIWRYGNATSHEIDLLEEGMFQNYVTNSRGVYVCPGCNNYFEWKAKTGNRIDCMICSQTGTPASYCFHCCQPWRNGQSNDECGNSGCTSDLLVLRMLRNAPKVTTVFGNVKIPSLRACPECGVIHERTGGCKQVHCSLCGTNFCFVCLQKESNGRWHCSYLDRPCSVAPVQDRIPRKFWS